MVGDNQPQAVFTSTILVTLRSAIKLLMGNRLSGKNNLQSKPVRRSRTNISFMVANSKDISDILDIFTVANGLEKVQIRRRNNNQLR